MAPSRVVAVLGSLCLAAACLSACASSSTTSSNADGTNQLFVATTVAPITSIASAVAGDRAHVEGIIPEGTDSHTYEPAPNVAQVFSKADLIVVNGLSLEDPTKDLAEKNKKASAKILEVGNSVIDPSQYIYDFSFPKKDGKPNPHLWTDPVYAGKYALVIAKAMSQADPKNASYYAKNAAAFVKQTTALANALRADQKTVPRKVLLTYHDAYAYFGRTFGWTIIGAVQPKNFEDPTPVEIARLIDQVKAQKVPTIFGSEVYPSKVLEEIGKATGVKYENSLRDDDLPGNPGDVEHSWLGLMKYDFTTMVTGLGGKATNVSAVPLTFVSPDKAVYPQ